MKCTNCSNGAAFGNKHCIECLKKSRERSAERYEKLKAQRKCKMCGGKVREKKGIYCSECKKDRKLRWHTKKSEGLCVVCGKCEPTNGLRCLSCYTKQKDNVDKRRSQRLSEGKCAFCDEKRVHTRLCLNHYLKFTSKAHFRTSKRFQELADLFERQGGKCPYTGKNLTLGVDASLDHIIPKCREGSNDIENLQWVYARVNFMKHDMLHEEFLDMVKLIHEHNFTLKFS